MCQVVFSLDAYATCAQGPAGARGERGSDGPVGPQVCSWLTFDTRFVLVRILSMKKELLQRHTLFAKKVPVLIHN